MAELENLLVIDNKSWFKRMVPLKWFLLVSFLMLGLLSFVFFIIGLGFLNFPYFILASIFLFFIPGFQFVKLFKLKISLLEEATLAIIFGIVLTTTIYYVFRFNQWEGVYFFVFVLLINLIFLFRLKKNQIHSFLNFSIKIDKISFFLIILLFINLLSISVTSFSSGLMYTDGLRFYEVHAHDSMFRLTLLGELKSQIPPTISYYSGVADRNYYFFGSLFINIINDFTNISFLDLHFRFVPLFLFGLLTVITYLMVYNLFKSRKIALLSTFFLFFIESLSFIPSLLATIFVNKSYIFHRWNGLFNAQSIEVLHESYPILFGTIIFFAGILTMLYFYEHGRKFLLILPIIIFGVMVQYRSFFTIIIFSSLLIVGIISYYYRKDKGPLIIMFFSFILSMLLMYKLYSPTGLKLKFFFAYPAVWLLEYLDVMSVDKLFTLLSSNFFLFITIYIVLFFVFIIGALGVRILTLPYVFKNAFKFKEINPVLLFTILCMFGLFLFPMFFVTDTINKLWIAGFFSHSMHLFSIFLGPVVFNFLNKKMKFYKLLIILLFILLGLFGSLHFLLFHSLTTQGYYLIDQEELASLEFIRKFTLEDDIIIHNIFDINYNNDPTLLNRTQLLDNYFAINAIGLRSTVISTKFSAYAKFIPADMINERVNDVNIFFSTDDIMKAQEVLKKYGVNYVYVVKDNPLSKNILPLLSVSYENSKYIIYKVQEINFNCSSN